MHWMYEYFLASTAELNSSCRNDAFVSMQLWCIFFLVCASVFIVYFLTVLQLLWTFDIKILRNLCWLFLLSCVASSVPLVFISWMNRSTPSLFFRCRLPNSSSSHATCQAFHMHSFTPGLSKSSFARLQFKIFSLCLKADLVLPPPHWLLLAMRF